VPGPTDKVSLYLNYATLLALSSKDVSRHNTPSRAHNLAKSIKDCVNYASEEYIVVSDCVLQLSSLLILHGY